jgi:glucokinase
VAWCAEVILVGDIGGTKATLALVDADRPLAVEERTTVASADHRSAADLIGAYADARRGKIQAACLGLPGPVTGDVARATNLPWTIRRDEIAARLGGVPVMLLNDLEACGWGIGVLPSDRLATLQEGTASAQGNGAIIAAGTGLGEAGLFWDGARHVPFASEGGHEDFAPRTARDIRLLEFLTKRHGHVSWERVASGRGLLNLFEFLRDVEGMPVPNTLAEALARETIAHDPAIISGAAFSERTPIAVEALDMLVRFLGAEAGNLALKLKATGGVYLAGGIAPKILPKLQDGTFVAAFVDKGRFADLLRQVPVRVVLDQAMALYGAARYAAEYL